MGYSFPYLVFIFYFMVIAIMQIGLPLEKKTRQYLNFSLLLVYVLFFGFRGFIGWDWYNYYPFFKNIEMADINSFEPGFVLYTLLIKNVFHSYQSFVLVSTIVNVILLHFFLKRYLNEKFYALGLVIFIAFSGFTLEIDLMRNVKSLLLFLISIQFIEQKRIVWFVLLNVLGLFFHWTSIIFLLLYFFLQRPISLKFFLITFVIGNVVVWANFQYIKPIVLFVAGFLGEDVNEKVTFYVGNKIYAQSFQLSYGYIVRTLTALLLLFYYDRVLNFSKSAVIFVNSFFILTILYLYFSELSIIIGRISILFNFSIAILIPILLQIIKPVSTKITLLALYLLTVLARTNSSTNNIFYDYENSLFNNHLKSYNERVEIYNKYSEKIKQQQ